MIRRAAKPFFLIGIAGILWFASWFQAAHDLWSASVVFLATTLLVFLYACWNWLSPRPIKLPLAPFVLSLLAAACLSASRSYDIDTTFLEIWGWFFAFCLFYLLLNVCEKTKDFDFFLPRAGMIIVPLAALGLWQQITGRPDGWGHWEIHATLLNSSLFAGFALSWIFIFWTQAIRGNLLAHVGLLACLVILVLARSLASYLCLLSGIAYYYRTHLRFWIARHGRAVLSVFVGLLVLSSILVLEKILVQEGPYKGSSRFYYWQAALAIWRLNPWTGVGLGGFATAFPYFRDPRVQLTLYAHSFPLQWLSETGLIGTLAILGLAMGILAILGRPSNSGSSPRNTTYKTTLLVLLLFSLCSITMEYLLSKILFLTVLAAALSSCRLRSYRIKPLWVFMFGLSVCMISPFWLRLFFGSQAYMRGMTLERDGQWALAEKSYAAAVSMDPNLAPGYEGLSRLAWRQFRSGGTPQDRLAAIGYARKAFLYQKRKVYLGMLRQYDASL